MLDKCLSILVIFLLLFISACKSVREHESAILATGEQSLSVGKVQKEIRVGMPGAKVIRVMGSPNIVTTDEMSREVWIYDKISSRKVYSSSSGGVSSLILGGIPVGAGILAGGLQPSYGEATGAASTSQRTLTVIIKFGLDKKVSKFSYHTSRF